MSKSRIKRLSHQIKPGDVDRAIAEIDRMHHEIERLTTEVSRLRKEMLRAADRADDPALDDRYVRRYVQVSFRALIKALDAASGNQHTHNGDKDTQKGDAD